MPVAENGTPKVLSLYRIQKNRILTQKFLVTQKHCVLLYYFCIWNLQCYKKVQDWHTSYIVS